MIKNDEGLTSQETRPAPTSENKVTDYFKSLVEKLPGIHDPEKIISLPESLKTLTLEQLLSDKHLFDSLVNCYQEVFGSEDIWGEGFICEKCGKIIPIEKDQTKCDCGGNLKRFYPIDELKKQIIEILTDTEQRSSFCTIIENKSQQETQEKKIDGFSWGVVDSIDHILKEIIEKRYQGDPSKLKEIFDLMKEKLPFVNLEEKILYIAELGVRKEARHHGMESIISLTRFGFERGQENGAKSALMWTSKKSPIYKICLACGFQEIFEIKEDEDSLVFLYLENFEPMLTLMQHKNAREGEVILAKSFRLLQNNK